jgi:hypothetical protein
MPEPLWVMSNLPTEQALRICHDRMKIDESVKDLNNLLGLDKLMNKSQPRMEQMAAFTLIANSVGCLWSEAFRDELYSPLPPVANA